MEKLTRSQFKEKYGWDPLDKGGASTPIPTSTPSTPSTPSTTGPSVTFTDAQMKRLSGQSSEPVSFTNEQKAYIESVGGLEAFRTTPQQNTQPAEQKFKPNKFTQAMEDYRPDYSGGVFSDISEGLGDVGVGVVKGVTRLPVNLLQAVTPDKMWADNSVLNSESERAKAFGSAVRGKTGLQKLGATGVDLATLFTPVGGSTVAARAGVGAGRLAELATGGAKAAELTGLTGKAVRGSRAVARGIGESMGGSALLGQSSENFQSDVLFGAGIPLAGYAYSKLKPMINSRGVKEIIAGLKDYKAGANEFSDKIMQDAIDEVSKMTPEQLENSISAIKENRSTFDKIMKPLKVNIFGAGSKGEARFNKASDIVTLHYMKDASINANDTINWTRAIDTVKNDKDVIGDFIGRAYSTIQDVAIPAKTAARSLKSKLATLGLNKYGPGGKIYRTLNQKLTEYARESASGGVGNITVKQLRGLEEWVSASIASNSENPVLKRLYTITKEGIQDLIESSAKKSGNKEIADFIGAQRGVYSQLSDAELLMESLSKAKTNPLGLSSVQKQSLQYIAGGVGSGVGAVLGGGMGAVAGAPISFFAAKGLSDLLSSAVAKRKIGKVINNTLIRAASDIRLKASEQQAKKLSEMVEQATKKKPSAIKKPVKPINSNKAKK